MTTRDFSVIRRRKNFVDILTPKRVNVAGYRLQAATNFDASYTTILTAPISSGYLDSTINSAVIHGIGNTDQIRIVFNPDTFNGGAGIADDRHFWLRFVPVDFAGSAGTPGPGTLILTDPEHYGNSRIQIAGNAAQGAAVANSLQINLPQQSQDFVIKNEDPTGGQDLYVATMVGGAEQQVGPQQVLKFFDGPVDLLMVRGAGGVATFSASFTNYLPL